MSPLRLASNCLICSSCSHSISFSSWMRASLSASADWCVFRMIFSLLSWLCSLSAMLDCAVRNLRWVSCEMEGILMYVGWILSTGGTYIIKSTTYMYLERHSVEIVSHVLANNLYTSHISFPAPPHAPVTGWGLGTRLTCNNHWLHSSCKLSKEAITLFHCMRERNQSLPALISLGKVYLPLFFLFIMMEFFYHTLFPIHREKNLKEWTFFSLPKPVSYTKYICNCNFKLTHLTCTYVESHLPWASAWALSSHSEEG